MLKARDGYHIWKRTCVFVMVLGVLVGGCETSPIDLGSLLADRPTSDVLVTPTIPPTPTPVPPRPDAHTLVVALPDEPAGFDPHLTLSPYSLIITHNIFDTLVHLDERGNLRAGLAESWLPGDEGYKWVFRLKKGVRFHNGREVVGSDVVASIERLLDPGVASPRAKDLHEIRTVTVTNTYTVAVWLNEPNLLLPYELASDWAAIVPEDLSDHLGTQPVGSGPFALEEWVRGDYVSLRRSNQKTDQPGAIDRLVFRAIPDEVQRVAALKAGEVDIALGIPPMLQVELQNDPGVRLVQGPLAQVTFLAFNEATPPLNDVRVRRALASAIDRGPVLTAAWNKMAIPVGGVLSPASPFYADLTDWCKASPGQAKSLLSEAGLTDGFKLTIIVPADETLRRAAEAIVTQLTEVGIQAEVQAVDWTVFLNQVYFERNFMAALVAQTTKPDASLVFMRYTTGNESNFLAYANPDYDRIFSETLKVAVGARADAYAMLQRMLCDDAVAVFFGTPLVGVAMNKSVSNCSLTPFNGIDLRNAIKK